MVPDTGGSTLQDILLGMGGLGAIIWAVYEKWMRHKLQDANTDSGVAVANANEALFNMLTQRMTSLEEEVRQVKKDLEREREYTRTLVSAMMASGLAPPPYPPLV